MLELYPDRVNPGVLSLSARAVKPQFHADLTYAHAIFTRSELLAASSASGTRAPSRRESAERI